MMVRKNVLMTDFSTNFQKTMHGQLYISKIAQLWVERTRADTAKDTTGSKCKQLEYRDSAAAYEGDAGVCQKTGEVFIWNTENTAVYIGIQQAGKRKKITIKKAAVMSWGFSAKQNINGTDCIV